MCTHVQGIDEEHTHVVMCTHVQGIDEESKLNLSPPQLECLVLYVLKEAASCVAETKGLTALAAADDKQQDDEM